MLVYLKDNNPAEEEDVPVVDAPTTDPEPAGLDTTTIIIIAAAAAAVVVIVVVVALVAAKKKKKNAKTDAE